MEQIDFKILVTRYLNGDLSAGEKRRFESWLEDMKTHEEGLTFDDLKLSKEDEAALYKRITSNLEDFDQNEAAPIVPKAKVPFSNWITRIAISIMIISVTAYAVWYVGFNTQGNDATAETKKLILQDGSLVWLKGQSSLAYVENQNENIRYAVLEGEALFEVAKDPSRPFLIECGDVTLRVLGTSFSVKSEPGGIQLSVLTGKVNLSYQDNPTGIDVTPNQTVVYKNGHIESHALPPVEVENLTANTHYNMQFSATTLKEVAKRIENKFNVTVTLSKEIASCRITANFTDQSLQNTLQMLSDVLGIEYQQTDNTITITGNSCNE
jgi:ferric-dicitrate binding protein FerR (iron transport regulator)